MIAAWEFVVQTRYAATTWGIDVIIMKSAAPRHALITAAAIRLVAAMVARSERP